MGSKANKCCCGEVTRNPCLDGTGFTLEIESTCVNPGTGAFDVETYGIDIFEATPQFGGTHTGPGNPLVRPLVSCKWYSEGYLLGVDSGGRYIYASWAVFSEQSAGELIGINLALFTHRCVVEGSPPSFCTQYTHIGEWEVDLDEWNGTDDIVIPAGGLPPNPPSPNTGLGCGTGAVGEITLTPVYP